VARVSSSSLARGGLGDRGSDDGGAGRPPELVVRTSPGRPRTTVVSLVGMHDLSTAPCLERRALEDIEGCDRLAVDLSRATFVDSSIVNALVRLGRQARPRGIAFQVVALDGSHPHRVLSLMGLLGHLGWVPSLAETELGDDGARRMDSPP